MALSTFLNRNRQPNTMGVQALPAPPTTTGALYDSPFGSDKPQDTPLPADGGGGLIDAPPIDGGLGLDRGLPEAHYDPTVDQSGTGVVDPNEPVYNASDPPDLFAPDTPITPTGGGVPSGGGDLNAAYKSALMKILGGGPTSGEDVANSPAAVAYKLSQQRGREQQQAQLAERSAQSGLSGGMEGLSRGLDFASAEATNNFTGNLAQDQEDQRMSRLMQALGLTSGTLNSNNQYGLDIARLQNDADYRALLLALGGGA